VRPTGKSAIQQIGNLPYVDSVHGKPCSARHKDRDHYRIEDEDEKEDEDDAVYGK